MTVGKYEYLWDGSSPDWVLVDLNAGTGTGPRCVVANTAERVAKIISDPSVEAEVIGNMLRHGRRVLSPAEWKRIARSSES